MRPTGGVKRKYPSLEILKRVREGYHLEASVPLGHKIPRTDEPGDVVTSQVERYAALAHGTVRIHRGISPASLFMSLRRAPVGVTCADTGRYTLVFLKPSFWLTWWPVEARNCRAATQTHTTVSLEERVRLGVFHEPEIPTPDAFPSPSEVKRSSYWQKEDEEEGRGEDRPGAVPTTEAPSTELYHYEASRFTKISHPPLLEYGLDSLNLVSELTPMLLAECLVKILIEECFLTGDIGRYSFLYRGCHLLSESGFQMLFSNLLTQCVAGDQDQSQPIRVCVFSKF
ncbi:unnamed protein product [Phytomonas sp. Hart1]|nr:unnamed protein product [Phytomonas sp. Hart1]|eukprot:CCW69379.1 unnamed protein product [Phytomonas sp. isolate Hart1]